MYGPSQSTPRLALVNSSPQYVEADVVGLEATHLSAFIPFMGSLGLCCASQ